MIDTSDADAVAAQSEIFPEAPLHTLRNISVVLLNKFDLQDKVTAVMKVLQCKLEKFNKARQSSAITLEHIKVNIIFNQIMLLSKGQSVDLFNINYVS